MNWRERWIGEGGLAHPVGWRNVQARGSVIGGGDFVPERVALPDSMAALTVPATSAADVVGQRLAEPVHAGVPLLQAELATQTELVPGFQLIAFPVASEHAAGGRL